MMRRITARMIWRTEVEAGRQWREGRRGGGELVRLRRGRRRARDHTVRHNHTRRLWSTILW